MAENQNQNVVAASIFDRLIDDTPEETSEYRPMRGFTATALRESVRRELERILNTRIDGRGSLLPNGTRTVIDYGIPDFTGFFPPNQENMVRLRQAIIESITAFEPRLRKVKVEVTKVKERNMLVARIDAMMVVDPISEMVSFPVIIKSNDAHVEVRNDD